MNKAINLTRSRIAAVLAVFLCMFLCTGMLTEAAFADQKEALSFSFDRNKVEAGDTVTGTLDANYADIANGMITITYDKDLELIRAENQPDRRTILTCPSTPRRWEKWSSRFRL